ncbi:MAG: hypothetical protein AB7G21_08600 [Dehalococcoidia bacterium]
MDVCWTCIGAKRARTAAGRASHRTCDRHAEARPSIARSRSDQARAGAVLRPQPRAGGYRLRQAR